MDHVLVACGGNGERWGKYLGVPKPLIRLEGETLVHRTVRLVRELVPPVALVLVVGTDSRLNAIGAKLAAPVYSDPPCGLDKLCGHLWSGTGRTVLLWGDTYYTEAALRTILSPQETEARFFGRNVPSEYSGKDGPELYALAMSPTGAALVRRGMNECRYLSARGEAGDRLCLWDVYAAVGGHGALLYCSNRYFTLVHDWTEDFDSPSCYDAWTSRRLSAGFAQDDSQYAPTEET